MAGTLVTPLPAAPAGLWDRGAPVAGPDRQRDCCPRPSWGAVLNGANVRRNRAGGWFGLGSAANSAAPSWWPKNSGTSPMRLRGQAGSDADMPEVWPEGSLFRAARRFGHASRPARFGARVGAALACRARAACAGRSELCSSVCWPSTASGLRPLRPVHLNAIPMGPDLAFSWIRRSRIDADSWAGQDVPLGEAVERYHLRIVDATRLRREVLHGRARLPLRPRPSGSPTAPNSPSQSKSPRSPTVSGPDLMQGWTSMTETANLALPLLQPAQAQKHVTRQRGAGAARQPGADNAGFGQQDRAACQPDRGRGLWRAAGRPRAHGQDRPAMWPSSSVGAGSSFRHGAGGAP